MSDTQFIFNKIENLDFYVKQSNVFNNLKEDIEKEKIILTSFEDEKLGSSVEKLDIAIYSEGQWSLIDVSDKVEGYNEIPLGYLLDGLEYTRVLIIIRRMSTLLLDKQRDGFSSYIFCAVPEKYSKVSEDKALYGLLAKSQIYLDGSDELIRKQIQENIVERNEEIYSRLFN